MEWVGQVKPSLFIHIDLLSLFPVQQRERERDDLCIIHIRRDFVVNSSGENALGEKVILHVSWTDYKLK